MANDFQNILSCAFKFQTLKRKQKKKKKKHMKGGDQPVTESPAV